MSDIVIRVENVSKQYRLGKVGTGSLAHDVNRAWHRIRGKEDPYLKIGETNDRSIKGSSEYVWALQDINFDVKQGEVLGIIGRNGAGKSTLLKILSRTTTPTTGSIKIKGRIASLLEVGTGFHPELSGRENIFLNGAILGMTRQEIKRKFDEIVDFAGVERYIDTPVKRYSSGMYVRLAFGVAAHLEPEILIVDEVLAVGDAEFQKKALGKMKDVSESHGRTVLFVSHNMAAIENLCNSVMVMQHGAIHFKGMTNEGLSHYSKSVQANIENKTNDFGNGRVDFKKINILNRNNELTNVLLSGDNTKFEVYYRNSVGSEITISIGIYDYFDTPMFLCNSQVKRQVFKEQGETLKAVLEISKLPLVEGMYYGNIEIKESNGNRAYYQQAFSFNVENGDFHGCGVLSNWKKGFLIDFEWK